jgi:hypothetical protein
MISLFTYPYWHVYKPILLPFAVIFIISTHIFNRRFTRDFDRKREQLIEKGCLHYGKCGIWDYGSEDLRFRIKVGFRRWSLSFRL